jgi:hypothetical protein
MPVRIRGSRVCSSWRHCCGEEDCCYWDNGIKGDGALEDYFIRKSHNTRKLGIVFIAILCSCGVIILSIISTTCS